MLFSADVNGECTTNTTSFDTDHTSMFVVAGKTYYNPTKITTGCDTNYHAFVRIIHNDRNMPPLQFQAKTSGRFANANHVRFASFTGSLSTVNKPNSFVFALLHHLIVENNSDKPTRGENVIAVLKVDSLAPSGLSI